MWSEWSNRIRALLESDQKWRVYVILVLVVVGLGTVGSLLANYTLIRDDEATRPRLAVTIRPASAADEFAAKGARIFVRQVNSTGGIQGRLIKVVEVPVSDASTRTLVDESRLVGVVDLAGDRDRSGLDQALGQRQVPVVPAGRLTEAGAQGQPTLMVRPVEEARFMANYARNILQARLMYVIHQSDGSHPEAAQAFSEVYKRFETPVRQNWPIDPQASLDEQLKPVLKAIGELGIGGVYIDAQPELAARILVALRKSGNALDLFGSSTMATRAFAEEVGRLSGPSAGPQMHGLVVASPILFDTANRAAQQFKLSFEKAFNSVPDWTAALAYEAARMALTKPGDDTLGGLFASADAASLDEGGQLPTRVGTYSGLQLVTSPVQLQPIAKDANFNYIEALRQGRVLYVNDRFMFRTNVVYVGLAMHDVADIDLSKETATLDFSIWFRYRGTFSPQDLVVVNAVDGLKLDKPEEAKEVDGVQYKRYRVKQKFKLNFGSDARSYGEHLAGLVFRHRQLNNNNIQYVVDVLGMPTGAQLARDLDSRQVVKSTTGWRVHDAWLSQDVVRERGDGELQYVGATGEQPFFSTITAGVRIRPLNTTARDVIDPEYFLYIGIFGLMGSAFAVMVQRRKWSSHHVLHSWLLQATFWPLALLSVGNILLDLSVVSLNPDQTRTAGLTYECAWWVMGARLADMAVRRFFWAPLEARSGRVVPMVMKFLVSLVFYTLALVGITAFVLNQTLTSLLATSGLLLTLVGLAIKANIANVFSGVILNIERPFRVGDFIKVNNVVGKVVDITWRITRIEASEGHIVSLANSKVSESLMENLSDAPNGIAAETVFYLPAHMDPAVMLPIIRQAMADSPTIICKDKPGFEPGARYRGIVNQSGQWVAQFNAGYRVATASKKSRASEELWTSVRNALIQQQVDFVPQSPSLVHLPASKPSV